MMTSSVCGGTVYTLASGLAWAWGPEEDTELETLVLASCHDGRGAERGRISRGTTAGEKA